ncbi:M99 family carboxypeptidase catalytic domain-containing protein [Nitrosophilus labii]|uniref:M99 family carboxypeptidase catalytic domain-containing protein n=1 Tax=Nitrosophilus labii TaxID=2706014 RepID=UPI001656D37A|nr:M99 family carboxypeptidase catalytic domain-containing protein [Nitrosophilus labii]
MRILLLLFIFSSIWGAKLHFKLYKKESLNPSNTLLVIGGVHGDEPGGYFAASFLVKYYVIKKGALWVVPNLNFDSIVKFRRGIYGDMNRKFATIKKNDPDFKIVKDIKEIILSKNVDLILNLHDGRGYYREKWENTIFNPYAWGQACIIDQKEIDGCRFGNLNEIAQKVNSALNKRLKKRHHAFHIKNTKTKFKDEQMRLSLTYFAITHNKPALAIETSKHIKDLATKIYYQLNAIEEFMKILEIEFERKFELNVKTINELLNNDLGNIVINKNTVLPLKNIKKSVRFFPMTGKNIHYESKDPLVTVIKAGKNYAIYRAYKKLTTLYPQYFKPDCKIKNVTFEVDENKKYIPIPSIINVKKSFKVLASNDIRVNVIGYSKKGFKNENGIEIEKKECQDRYSIDKLHKKYRVEFYKDKSFCGSVIVSFE